MIVLYYEIDNLALKFYRFPPYVYWKRHSSLANSEVPAGPKILSYQANRIWSLDTDTGVVTWKKNRDLGTMAPVDMGEFVLAQLSAVPYDGDMIKWKS